MATRPALPLLSVLERQVRCLNRDAARAMVRRLLDGERPLADGTAPASFIDVLGLSGLVDGRLTPALFDLFCDAYDAETCVMRAPDCLEAA